ncbi:MAG: dienelactone hydrolase family protein [Phormidesmis sp. RL_2_1]|nr:dienelactone hydrolase family protein [Phormidesmis sp. RL_2_1]
MLKKLLLIGLTIACVIGLTTLGAKADIIIESVVYEIDGQPYEGYFALNEGFGDQQPVVLLIHDWNGIDEYEQRRVEMLAESGYAAFAADLYGQDVRPTTVEESQAQSGMLYGDRQTMRQRLSAGLAAAQSMAGVDPQRVVAIGYCFGGAAVLEFARAGADLDGFVSFHGGLATPAGQDYTAATGPLLILHGGDDPVAPMTEVAALADELNAAGVDYDMEIYGGARHSFTVWSADRETSRYDGQADIQSWDALMEFLDKSLG